jgi:hypothetical protein
MQVGLGVDTAMPVGRGTPSSRRSAVTECERSLATYIQWPASAKWRGNAPPLGTSSTGCGTSVSAVNVVTVSLPRLATYTKRPSGETAISERWLGPAGSTSVAGLVWVRRRAPVDGSGT